jgi:hypothetical protein
LKSALFTFLAFICNLCAIGIAVRIMPFGETINIGFKLLLAFIITNGQVLAFVAAHYAIKENRPSRKAPEPSGNN